ncbi:NAD kinase [Amylibacter ulvae]|uniref:NAD kinase n=1 Tax=Paramylibacter ulvae TaxID=1651968 RepID=A0ABQ3CZJ0_9RHOB|nr:NAD kinase [Amylibacter ulvae]GHA46038.1 NAD kinase [Amylibacter ulvae]
MALKLNFVASRAQVAQKSLAIMIDRYGNAPAENADAIIALGGDGFMLETLHSTQHLSTPVFGLNRGSVGFLMNEYAEDNLEQRIKDAEMAVIHPLAMTAFCADGSKQKALAINEVSLLRAGPQAAKLKISVDDKVRLSELVCDGALLATPAGSTAYNYSAHGPILPIGAEILALTAMSAFRPRRWRGALLPMGVKVRFDVLEPEKRPVTAAADSAEARDVLAVEIISAPDLEHRILFDPGHGLEERLIREQFA